jgi:hypothetical protein
MGGFDKVIVIMRRTSIVPVPKDIEINFHINDLLNMVIMIMTVVVVVIVHFAKLEL